MIKTKLPIYLASKSPRRRKLLKQLNLKFKSFTVDVDEKFLPGEKPSISVKRLANEKMVKAKEKVKKGIIITADTIVVLQGRIIGKPINKKNAKQILRKLSGNVHIVYTGFAVYNSSKENCSYYIDTKKRLRKLIHNELDLTDDFYKIIIVCE